MLIYVTSGMLHTNEVRSKEACIDLMLRTDITSYEMIGNVLVKVQDIQAVKFFGDVDADATPIRILLRKGDEEEVVETLITQSVEEIEEFVAQLTPGKQGVLLTEDAIFRAEEIVGIEA